MDDNIIDFLEIEGNNISLKADFSNGHFAQNDNKIHNFLITLLYKKVKASEDSRKNYRLDCAIVSDKTRSEIIEKFKLNPKLPIKIFNVYIMDHYLFQSKIIDDDYVEYHYTWTMYEMGTNKNNKEE